VYVIFQQIYSRTDVSISQESLEFVEDITKTYCLLFSGRNEYWNYVG